MLSHCRQANTKEPSSETHFRMTPSTCPTYGSSAGESGSALKSSFRNWLSSGRASSRSTISGNFPSAPDIASVSLLDNLELKWLGQSGTPVSEPSQVLPSLPLELI